MGLLDSIALLVSLAAVMAWLNYRFLRLPQAIGLMLIALAMSLGIIVLGKLGLGTETAARAILGEIDFSEALMQGMLSFLLFAGALHLDINHLAKQKWVVAALATGGVLVTTALVGLAMWSVMNVFMPGFPLIYALLFGALIAPTDPIAVLSILKSAHVSESLQTKISGESLFNDGVAVVVFIVLLRIATGSGEITAGGVTTLFLLEAVGGAGLGLILGYGVYQMLKSIDSYPVEVLLSLALVMGGYSLASALHLSGPIAIVCAGLLIGNHGRAFAMSPKTREHLDHFWELLDETLNAILFVFIGLEVLILEFVPQYWVMGLIAIAVVLAARFISVSGLVTAMKAVRTFSPGAIRILTWGGLRGGISVALALALPAGPWRDAILAITYIVVVFSILVQGLTIGPLARKLSGK